MSSCAQGMSQGVRLPSYFAKPVPCAGAMLAESMATLLASDPEMIAELVALVQSEAPGLEGLRALAVRALAVQVR